MARIEQTERPDAKAKGSKTVNREVCAVITKGTKTHSYIEGTSETDLFYLNRKLLKIVTLLYTSSNPQGSPRR